MWIIFKCIPSYNSPKLIPAFCNQTKQSEESASPTLKIFGLIFCEEFSHLASLRSSFHYNSVFIFVQLKNDVDVMIDFFVSRGLIVSNILLKSLENVQWGFVHSATICRLWTEMIFLVKLTGFKWMVYYASALKKQELSMTFLLTLR